MTSIRQLLADVPREKYHERMTGPKDVERPEFWDWVADALLASPELAVIIDIAASVAEQTDLQLRFVMSAEVRALLESWRGSRAERPTP